MVLLSFVAFCRMQICIGEGKPPLEYVGHDALMRRRLFLVLPLLGGPVLLAPKESHTRILSRSPA